jgi:hypothetical protein
MRQEGTTMQTVTLSEAAIAVLRFEIRGWKAKRKGARLASYRELAAAGIMEPVPGTEVEYRLTREGSEHGEAILEQEAERIERERYEPPDASRLSEAARKLLRTCVAGGCPEGDEANRPAYRELVAARIMVPMGSFSKGDECVFRFTYWGHKLRFELAGLDSPSPSDGPRPRDPATPSASPARSPSPGR